MNNPLALTTRLIQTDDLPQVARVHRKAFADSALTKLGYEPVRRYYDWQLTGPHDCYAVGIFDQGNNLLGFCFSGIFRGSLSGFLQKNKKFLAGWLLVHPWLIANPLVIDRIKMALKLIEKRPKLIKTITGHANRSFGILAIAVDPEKQGQGIGRIIMESVEEEARKKAFSQMHLSVHPTNRGAIAFYEQCGWKKFSVDPDNWAGSMIKTLSNYPHNS